MMKWFWYSLIGFCLLMCNCRTKKIDSNVKVRNDVRSDLAYLNESVKIDTTRTSYYAKGIQTVIIEEDIIATEYDKESGKPIKETKTKRKVVQDSDKVVSSEEERRVYEVKNDSSNHVVDLHEMAESEIKEESKGGQESFGKWLGIVLGCFSVGLFVYLGRKIRVNKPP